MPFLPPASRGRGRAKPPFPRLAHPLALFFIYHCWLLFQNRISIIPLFGECLRPAVGSRGRRGLALLISSFPPCRPHVEHPRLLPLRPRTPTALFLVFRPPPRPLTGENPDLGHNVDSGGSIGTSRRGGQTGRVPLICPTPHLSLSFLSFPSSVLLDLCFYSMDVDPGPLPASSS